MVNVKFIAYEDELKKDMINKTQRNQLKIKVTLVLINSKIIQ